MQIPLETLESLLQGVQRPARYIGGEWNAMVKDWDTARVRTVLAYPDAYEIGMSNLGLAILYDVINKRPEYLAERTYTPWHDMSAAMQAANMPLYSLENRRPLAEFDVIGFSLQYELNYSNVLSMLSLAGVPLLAAARTAAHPLVMAGGSCAYNPEPMSDFIDAFAVGDGEDVTLEMLDAVDAWKAAGGRERETLLAALARIPGVYVPALYGVESGAGGALRRVPLHDDMPTRIRKRVAARLGPVPTHPVVPNFETVHDRGMVEIQRGCSHGCRFCQAGVIYRPIRERPVEEVLAAIDDLVANTGYSEIGLVSLSSSDHSGIAEIVSGVLERHGDKGLAISLPSLRIDSFSVKLAEMIQSTRKTGFTFAPEAGSQRLRDIINKGVSEEDLLRTAEAAFTNGWNRIKLYFMLGLPGEQDEDMLEMARLIRELSDLGRRIRHRPVDINVSVSTFVPKAHTPFQWAPLADPETVAARQALLRANTHSRNVRLSWSDGDTTWLEAVLSRGDRRLGAVIRRAWELGARFDAWTESYRADLWRRAFDELGIDPSPYAAARDLEAPLAWDHIDVGVSTRFLRREMERARDGALSEDCRQECHACGILESFGALRDDASRELWGCP